MPIQVQWFDKQHSIIYATFKHNWNLHSYQTFVDTTKNMIESVAHPVHLIHDLSQSNSTPRDLLAGLHYANKHMPDNQGLLIFVNANSVIQAYVLMAKRTGLPVARHIYHANSREEALQLIKTKAHRLKTS